MRIRRVALRAQIHVRRVVLGRMRDDDVGDELVLVHRLFEPNHDLVVEPDGLLHSNEVRQRVVRQFGLPFREQIRLVFAHGEFELPERRAGAHLHLLPPHDGLHHVVRLLLFRFLVLDAVDGQRRRLFQRGEGGLRPRLVLLERRVQQAHSCQTRRGLKLGLLLPFDLGDRLGFRALLVLRLRLGAHLVHDLGFFVFAQPNLQLLLLD
mmetsp:Transcript_25317/g.78078  ORF Transcript_25317/g.78078 Transcript_25317/m.78078 type:complete len:208 (+) Transcript_25317:1168-1791(+)